MGIVKVAYPWVLGGVIPPGYAVLTDDDGRWLTDDDGFVLVVIYG